MAQAEGVGLGIERGAGPHPSQAAGGRHLRQQFVAHGVQLYGGPAGGHPGGVRERHVRAARRELSRQRCHRAVRHAQDHAHIGLIGVDLGQRVHPQDAVRDRGHLVG
jgi:hypothetical protein